MNEAHARHHKTFAAKFRAYQLVRTTSTSHMSLKLKTLPIHVCFPLLGTATDTVPSPGVREKGHRVLGLRLLSIFVRTSTPTRRTLPPPHKTRTYDEIGTAHPRFTTCNVCLRQQVPYLPLHVYACLRRRAYTVHFTPPHGTKLAVLQARSNLILPTNYDDYM